MNDLAHRPARAPHAHSHAHVAAPPTALVALVALVAAFLMSLPTTAQAIDVGTRAATPQGKVRGEVLGSRGAGAPSVTVRWFTKDWTYLGSRSATGGGYSLTLAPGTYRLQFSDKRPTYDVSRYAPTDATVTVRAGHTTVKSVRMRTGASIGGTVRAGGKAAGGARVVAASVDERSYETTADSHGRFALGGLPAGTYSVFTYDKRAAFVGRSIYLKNLKSGVYRSVDISLSRRAGSLIVDMYAGDRAFRGVAWLTAVSRSTGQFWTARASRGSVTFRGLAAGSYDIVVPALGNYFGARVKVKAKVRAGRAAFGSVRLTKRGGWVVGKVVDANSSSNALSGADVRLVDSHGTTLDRTTSGSDGSFVLDGPLATQSGLTVVAGPPSTSPYLGQGTSYCKYGRSTESSVSIRAGRGTDLGPVGLPHLPNAQQDGVQCWTLLPASRVSGDVVASR